MAKKNESSGTAKQVKAGSILAAAEALFFKFGIRKTTIGDICRAAAISRMTFYKYFRDKPHIAEVVVNKLIDDMIGAFRRSMDRDVPYSQKIAEFIGSKLRKADGMSNAFIQELFLSPYPKLQALVRRRMDENLQVAIDEFRKAQRQGHIRSGIKPEFLLVFMESWPTWPSTNA